MRQARFLVAIFALALPTIVRAQPGPAMRQLAPPTLALVITYGDGRVGQGLVSEKPTFGWNPFFPRTTGTSASSDGRALKLARVRAGNDARVTVSILSGPLYRDEQIVTTVTVSKSQPVTVDRLRDFGVEPIMLSLIDAAPMIPFVPGVVSVSPEIEIGGIELRTVPFPGYRITVRNVASQAVALFSVQSYRGTDRSVSGVMRGDSGQPAMMPGETHSFEIPAGTGRAQPGATLMMPDPPGVIEIDAVLWEDGTTVGRHGGAPLNFVITTDGGRRLQYERALQVLRTAQSQPGRTGAALLSLIRRGLEAIPETDDTRLKPARRMMQATRAMVLNDLETFEALRIRDAAEVRLWIGGLIAKYEDWLKRLAA